MLLLFSSKESKPKKLAQKGAFWGVKTFKIIPR